jgi:RimJ/RimL family protein N-acetyltransferase
MNWKLAICFCRNIGGQGLGTEIAAFLVRRAQEIEETPRLKAIIDPQNIGSRKILEKLNFQEAERIDSIELPGLVLRRPLFL